MESDAYSDYDSDGWHSIRSTYDGDGSDRDESVPDLDIEPERTDEEYHARTLLGHALYALNMVSGRCGSVAAEAFSRRASVRGWEGDMPPLMHMALKDTQDGLLTSDQRAALKCVLETLPQLGARTDLVDPASGGMTVLGLAVKLQRVATVDVLLQHATKEGSIDARMNSGCTAVGIALERMLTSTQTPSAAVDSRRILKMLLDAGADVRIGPPTGVSPLEFVGRASSSIRAAFLHAAHTRDDIMNAIDVNDVAYDLARSASEQDCLEFVQAMHPRLDRLWRSDAPPCWTLIHAVFRRRFYRAARLLMALGWDVNIATADSLDTCAHVLVRGWIDDGAAHEMWTLADENPRVDPFRGLPFDVPNANGHTAIDVCLRQGSVLLAAKAIAHLSPWDEEGSIDVDTAPERMRIMMSATFLAAVWRNRVDVMSRCQPVMGVHPSALRPTPFTDIIREAILADAASSLSWLLELSTPSWEGASMAARTGAVADDSVCQLLPPPLQMAAESERAFTVLLSHMLDRSASVSFVDMHSMLPLLFRAGNMPGIDAVCMRGMVPPTVSAAALLRMAMDAERNLGACVEYVLRQFGDGLHDRDIDDAYTECVIGGCIECVGALLCAGARPEIGWDVAVCSERCTLVQAILDGVDSDDVRLRLVSSPINRSEYGDDYTPLMHAATHGCPDLLRVLLDAGGGEALSRDIGAWKDIIWAISNRVQDACEHDVSRNREVQDLCACIAMVVRVAPAHA